MNDYTQQMQDLCNDFWKDIENVAKKAANKITKMTPMTEGKYKPPLVLKLTIECNGVEVKKHLGI